jgi:glutaredoxin 3
MLSCQQISERASDYLNGDLPWWARLEAKLHLFLCDRCRRHLHQIHLVVGALRLSRAHKCTEHDGEEEAVRLLLNSRPGNSASAVEVTPPEVVIYTTPWCPYCRRAKALLDRKGVRYREIGVARDPARRAEMIARADGRHTVPQIFIGGRGIGGSDDLRALDSSGELDRLLGHS